MSQSSFNVEDLDVKHNPFTGITTVAHNGKIARLDHNWDLVQQVDRADTDAKALDEIAVRLGRTICPNPCSEDHDNALHVVSQDGTFKLAHRWTNCRCRFQGCFHFCENPQDLELVPQ